MTRDPIAAVRPGGLLFDRYRVDVERPSQGITHVFAGRDEVRGLPVTIRVPTVEPLGRPGLDRAVLVAARRWAAAPAAATLAPQACGLVDRVPCIVTPAAPGPSWAALFPSTPAEPTPPERLAARIRAVALALDALHAAGFLHRHLSAESVGFDGEGRGVLEDGVFAEALAAVLGEREAARTALYRAPETLTDDTFGAASDRYALACLLLDALVGAPVARASNADDAQAPAAAVARLPRPLAAVLSRALDSDPTRRFETAVAFADALASAVQPASDVEVLSVTPPAAPPAVTPLPVVEILSASAADGPAAGEVGTPGPVGAEPAAAAPHAPSPEPAAAPAASSVTSSPRPSGEWIPIPPRAPAQANRPPRRVGTVLALLAAGLAAVLGAFALVRGTASDGGADARRRGPSAGERRAATHPGVKAGAARQSSPERCAVVRRGTVFVVLVDRTACERTTVRRDVRAPCDARCAPLRPRSR